MKNILNFDKFVNESLQDEIEKLSGFGVNVVDRCDVGPYVMLLLHNTEEDIYEVSLTTGEEEFTTFSSQVKRPTTQENIVPHMRKLIEKVGQWLSEYGDLVVGSLNKSRTGVYSRIFKNAGFNLSEIEVTPADDNFPESYNFTVYAD